MAWTKAKMAIAVGVGILLAVGTTMVIIKESNVFRVKLTGIDAYISDSDMQAFLDAPPMMAIQNGR